MKNFIILLIISASFFLTHMTIALSTEANLTNANQMVIANPTLEGRLIEVQINGMVCDFCAQSLGKVLRKKEAVEKIDLSLETKLMIIVQKEGMTLSDEEVREAVNQAGYDIASIKRV